MSNGFCQPLLLQIAHQLRLSLPAIFADHPLIEMWSYKCDQKLNGLDKHANCAAVNVNFWISPDDANCRPGSGGLEVFRAEAPHSWDIHSGYINRRTNVTMLFGHRCKR